MPDAIQHACALTRKGYQWARTGHPWVYRDDLASAEGEHGDVVRVLYEKRCIGSAFLGLRSKIALRWIERTEDPALPDADFWRRRLETALARRRDLATRTDAYRVVHDSADGMPGLIVDRYGPVAVVQTTIAGTERILSVIAQEASRLLGVRAVVARNDVAVREKEGLPVETRVIAGAWEGLAWVHEDGPSGRIQFPADPLGGQKTGAYLDQRENRWRAADLARGRVLDAFSYSGLFSLHAARRATEVVTVDSSEAALDLCAAAAERNGLANIRRVRANVFDWLKDARDAGERFDLVTLDPPAFAKSRREIAAAVRGYREINRRAMGLLAAGGTLVTCSCSYNLGEQEFLDVLREAAADARADFLVLEKRGQASDHPVTLCHPESAYLKCIILQRA